MPPLLVFPTKVSSTLKNTTSPKIKSALFRIKKITDEVEKNIINELEKEKKLIEDKNIPVTSYNYSYIKDQIHQKYAEKMSLPTIIAGAKKEGFYKRRHKKRGSYDREVLTNYVGELIQHDSSLWMYNEN